MKPELEQIDIATTQHSFRFFKRETVSFTPFWHYHPEVELTYIINGDGTRFVGNSIAPFSNGDLVLVGKNIPHNWVGVKHNTPEKQKAIVFQFNTRIFSSFKECERFHALFELAKRGIQFKKPTEAIVALITRFEYLTTIQQLGALLELLNLLVLHKDKTLLATEIYVYNHNQKHRVDKFARVNNYILDHLEQKLTVAQMADFTHMVPQSFCRWFKQNSGHSFITFLNKTRVENACHLLAQRKMPIQEIAFCSGFESLSHFNRTFKKYKHQSPREFVRTHIH